MKDTLYLADYILFPLNISKIGNTEVVLSVSHFQQNAKVISVNIFNNKIFVPCTPSLEDCWVEYQLRWIQVSISLLDMHISNRMSGSTAMESYKHLRNFKMSCAFSQKLWHYNSTFSAVQDCVKCIIAASSNCTSWWRREFLKNSRFRISLSYDL